MVAAEFNNENVVEYLLEETEIALEARNVDGETALCIAIHRGHVELVRMLCEVSQGTPRPHTPHCCFLLEMRSVNPFCALSARPRVNPTNPALVWSRHEHAELSEANAVQVRGSAQQSADVQHFARLQSAAAEVGDQHAQKR